MSNMNNIKNNLKIVSSSKNSKEENGIELFQEKIKKHQTRLFVVGGAVIFFSVAYFFYQSSKTNSEKIAQDEMFEAVMLFEKENYTEALAGTDSNAGLLAIAKKYSGTQAANLANFYIGVSYMNLKDYDNAIEFFKKASFEDCIMQARTIALIGDSYAEKGNYMEAILYYEKAANTKPTKSYSPVYLEKAAMAYETMGDNAGALGRYEAIAQKYPDYENDTMVKHIERLKAMCE